MERPFEDHLVGLVCLGSWDQTSSPFGSDIRIQSIHDRDHLGSRRELDLDHQGCGRPYRCVETETIRDEGGLLEDQDQDCFDSFASVAISVSLAYKSGLTFNAKGRG